MPKSEKDRPVHEYRLGRVVGTVWYNENESGRGWHNVQLVRLYRDDDGNWQRSQSFGRDDLPLVMKVANALHTWIHQTWRKRTSPLRAIPNRQRFPQRRSRRMRTRFSIKGPQHPDHLV